jgi:hypothetical protein
MGSRIPNLIHPVPVTFQLQDRTITVFDRRGREPVQQVTRMGENPRTGDAITIRGQVSFYFASAKLEEGAQGFKREGMVEDSIGYVALRFVDMIRYGLATYDSATEEITMILQRGDRITKLGRRVVDYYVTGFKDFAHYPGPKQTLIEVRFHDRHPGYQQGDL